GDGDGAAELADRDALDPVATARLLDLILAGAADGQLTTLDADVEVFFRYAGHSHLQHYCFIGLVEIDGLEGADRAAVDTGGVRRLQQLLEFLEHVAKRGRASAPTAGPGGELCVSACHGSSLHTSLRGFSTR